MSTAHLKDKVVVITGSTQGIGLGIAESFGECGCKIVISGSRSADRAKPVISSLTEKYSSSSFEYCQVDLSKIEDAAKLINFTVTQFGSIDVLINNAGVQHVSAVESFGAENWERVIAINLNSCFHTISNSIEHMKKNGWGRIINISSVHGLVASPYKSAYVAAKHGLNGLSKVVALEQAENKITCNAICPGWVLTPLVEKQIDAIAAKDNCSKEEATTKLLSEKEPTKQFTTPKQIGDMAVFLCSSAGDNITGAQFAMDGAWSAR